MFLKLAPCLVLLAVIVINSKMADGVKCYACGTFPTTGSFVPDTKEYLSCPNPFDKTKSGEAICNGQCRKTRYKRGGEEITAKGCSPLCYPQDTDDLKTTCCNTDFCNGVPKWSGSLLVIVVSLVLTTFALFGATTTLV